MAETPSLPPLLSPDELAKAIAKDKAAKKVAAPKPAAPKEQKPISEVGGRRFGGVGPAPAPAVAADRASSASAVLNVLNTGAAFVAGFADSVLAQSQESAQKNPYSRVDPRSKQQQPDTLKAISDGWANAGAWTTKYKKTTAWNDILVKRLGWDPENPATHVVGFAGDVVLDPLNLIDAPLNAILKVTKGASKGLEMGLDAIKLEKAGETSLEKATQKTIDELKPKQLEKLSPEEVEGLKTVEGRVAAIEKITGKKPVVSAQLQNAVPTPLALTKLPGAAKERYLTTAERLAADYTYRTTPLKPKELAGMSTTDKILSATAAGLEAARKGFVGQMVSANTTDFLRKYAKRDVKLTVALTKGILPKLEKDVKTTIKQEGNDWVILSGNGEELGRQATKQEAQTYVDNVIRKGISASTLDRKTIADLRGEPNLAETVTTADALKVKPKTPDLSVINKILGNVQKLSQEATGVAVDGTARAYGSFEDVIGGLKAGDSIGVDVLKKIIRALDPEKTALSTAVRKDNEGAADYLKEVLLGQGTETFDNIKAVMKEAEDFKLIASQKGIDSSEEIYAVLAAVNAPETLSDANQIALLKSMNVKNPEKAQTAAGGALRFNKASDRTKNLVEWSIDKVFAARNKDLNAIQAAEDYNRGYTKIGEQAEFSERQRLTESSRAVLAKELNISAASEIASTIVKGARRDWMAKVGEAERTGKKIYNPAQPTSKAAHDEFATYMLDKLVTTLRAADDYLLFAGKRINISKIAPNEKAFVASLKQYGVPANSYKDYHTAFFGMADVLQTFIKAGKADLVKRALFPFGKANAYETDSFLWMNLLDASRSSLEQAGKRATINLSELEARLLYRFKGDKVSRVTRSAEMKALAKEMAAHLAAPDTVKALKNAHMQKAIGYIDDYARTVRSVADDIFDTARAAYIASTNANNLTLFQRTRIVQDTLRKFFYSSEIFNLSAGSLVETMFRSYATRLLNGTDLDKELIDELVNVELKNFTADFYNLRKQEKAISAANEAARTGRASSAMLRGKLENKLVEREQLLEVWMAKRAEYENAGPVQYDAWRGQLIKIQEKLSKARIDAYNAGVQTRHYYNGEWVPAAKYDYEAAVRELGDTPDAVLLDAPANYLKPVPAKTPKDEYRVAAAQREIAEINAEESWLEAEKLLNAGAFKQPGFSEADEIMRAIQHAQATKIQKATHLPDMYFTTATYGANKADLFNPNLTEAERKLVGTNDKVKEVRQKWQAIGSQAEETLMYWHTREADAMRTSHSVAGVLANLAKKWKHISDDVVDNVWDAVVRGTKLRSNDEVAQAFYSDIKRIWDDIIGAGDNNIFVREGISIKDVVITMNKFGSGAKSGLPDAKVISSDNLDDFLNLFPIGNKPKGVAKNTTAFTEWQKNKELLKKSELTAFNVMSNLAHAIQMVKFDKGMIEDFFIDNSWKNYFDTLEQAVASKMFVKPIIRDDIKHLAKYIPSPEDGGLVLKSAWDSFGATMREKNAIFENPVTGKLRTLMNIQGIMKSHQTIAAPGFQLMNFISDFGINIDKGVVNPVHYGIASRLSVEEAVETGKGDLKLMNWFLDNRIEQQFRNLEGLVESKVKGFEGSDAKVQQNSMTSAFDVLRKDGSVMGSFRTEKEARDFAVSRGDNHTTSFVIYVNGKPTKVNFSDNDLRNLMRSKGIIISNIYANDVQGLADELETRKGEGKSGVMRKLGARLGKANRAYFKLPGDIAAFHGNIPRISQALHVMQGRSWASIDDALNAAAREVNLYHPTIQSLASSERRIGRAVIGYYTWLRMAHLALFEMLKTHPASVTIPSKLQYAASNMLGYDPSNIGGPWEGEGSLAAPSYITKSVIGIRAGDPSMYYILKPAFLQTSVLDTFNFSWDNRKSAMDNAWQAGQFSVNTLGKMVNPVIQRGFEIITGHDWSTGATTNGTPQEAFDALMQDFTISQALKGIGVYTPYKKQIGNTETPITSREQQDALLRFLTRMGQVNVLTPQNIKRYQQEERDAYK